VRSVVNVSSAEIASELAKAREHAGWAWRLLISRGVAVRQDLCGRAFRFAGASLTFCDRLSRLGPTQAHIADQLFQSAASIGANLEEGVVANSRRDMAAKYAIALREAREARYWLRLLATRPEHAREAAPLVQEATEFVAMLTVSVRKLRSPTPPPPSPEQ
jgi:four helix bundle protein